MIYKRNIDFYIFIQFQIVFAFTVSFYLNFTQQKIHRKVTENLKEIVSQRTYNLWQFESRGKE